MKYLWLGTGLMLVPRTRQPALHLAVSVQSIIKVQTMSAVQNYTTARTVAFKKEVEGSGWLDVL